jgi:oligo-1,6-glucosidase
VLTELKASLGRWQAGLAELGWNSLYWNNHDQPRVVSRFGDDGEHRVQSAKALATVLHLHRGTPYIYQGEEIGMTNYPFASIDDFQDIESRNHFAQAVAAGEDREAVLDSLRSPSRDNARTPMQWDATDSAGFTTGTPWLQVNPNYLDVNVQAAVADPQSVHAHYRALIALRHHDQVVADGDFTMLLADDEQIYAFVRRLADAEVLVLANLSGSEAEPGPLPDWRGAQTLIGTAPGDPARTLQPWEYRVLRRASTPSASS